MTNYQHEARVLRDVRTRADEARELAAADLLGWDKVTKALGAAAGKGLGQAVFAPPPGVDLRKASAAMETADRLRGGGFTVEWKPRREAPDAPEFFALVVSW